MGMVEAWDADQTEANNRISFSLSGSGANNFMIRGSVLGSGQAVGRLSLPSDVSLDYETQASFSLIVSAENADAQGRETTPDHHTPILRPPPGPGTPPPLPALGLCPCLGTRCTHPLSYSPTSSLAVKPF